MTHPDKGKNKIAIIGNGCAGAECLKTLRESGYGGEIHVFSDSKWPPYNPMLTTYYIAGKISFEQLFPCGSGEELYRQYRVDVHSASPVVALDAEKRVVANQAGFEIDYDQCLIASGAFPFLPPIEGTGSSKIYVLRTVEDAIRLKEAVTEKPRKALVVGASMTGIKLVELLYQAGIEVCLADLADHLFPLNAHPECAGIIEDHLRRMGIKLRFGSCISKVEDIPGGIKASFVNSTESEEADLIVLCIGVKANTAFIDRRQVEVKQGVLVDEYMQTGVPGLYAAGDVSQGGNLLTGKRQIIGLLANARYQGRTAGRNMAGIRERFSGNIPHNITHFLGLDFVGIGDVCEYDRTEKSYDGNKFRQFFWKNGRLTGANLVDSCIESGIIKNELLKGLRQSAPARLNSLADIQNLPAYQTCYYKY